MPETQIPAAWLVLPLHCTGGSAQLLLNIAANGYIFDNPGGDLTGEWTIINVNDKWHNQEGDWSANDRKESIAGINNYGTPEIFISHRERGGYPLAYYSRNADGSYEEHVVLEELPAAHTLQVFEMDLEGDMDIVTGINFARAVNLEPKADPFEVMVLVNDGTGKFTRKVVENEGIYNGRVADFEGDGDHDIFRNPTTQPPIYSCSKTKPSQANEQPQ